MPAMFRLLHHIRELSLAEDLAEVQRVSRRAVRELTGADGVTFVLREGDNCHYADEDAIAPLWKGCRFPMSTCISGWVMLNRRSVAIPDITVDARIPQDAYRPTFVKSLLMVPIRSADPVGAIGVYWARLHEASEIETRVAQAIADAASAAMARIEQKAELRARIERSRREVERLSSELNALGATDALTGLHGAGSFRAVARQSLSAAQRLGARLFFASFLVDAPANAFGPTATASHGALIFDLAGSLQDHFRKADLVARLAPHCFGVLGVLDSRSPEDLEDAVARVRAAFRRQSRLPLHTDLKQWDATTDESIEARLGALEAQFAERAASVGRVPIVAA